MHDVYLEGLATCLDLCRITQHIGLAMYKMTSTEVCVVCIDYECLYSLK